MAAPNSPSFDTKRFQLKSSPIPSTPIYFFKDPNFLEMIQINVCGDDESFDECITWGFPIVAPGQITKDQTQSLESGSGINTDHSRELSKLNITSNSGSPVTLQSEPNRNIASATTISRDVDENIFFDDYEDTRSNSVYSSNMVSPISQKGDILDLFGALKSGPKKSTLSSPPQQPLSLLGRSKTVKVIIKLNKPRYSLNSFGMLEARAITEKSLSVVETNGDAQISRKRTKGGKLEMNIDELLEHFYGKRTRERNESMSSLSSNKVFMNIKSTVVQRQDVGLGLGLGLTLGSPPSMRKVNSGTSMVSLKQKSASSKSSSQPQLSTSSPTALYIKDTRTNNEDFPSTSSSSSNNVFYPPPSQTIRTRGRANTNDSKISQTSLLTSFSIPISANISTDSPKSSKTVPTPNIHSKSQPDVYYPSSHQGQGHINKNKQSRHQTQLKLKTSSTGDESNTSTNHVPAVGLAITTPTNCNTSSSQSSVSGLSLPIEKNPSTVTDSETESLNRPKARRSHSVRRRNKPKSSTTSNSNPNSATVNDKN